MLPVLHFHSGMKVSTVEFIVVARGHYPMGDALPGSPMVLMRTKNIRQLAWMAEQAIISPSHQYTERRHNHTFAVTQTHARAFQCVTSR